MFEEYSNVPSEIVEELLALGFDEGAIMTLDEIVAGGGDLEEMVSQLIGSMGMGGSEDYDEEYDIPGSPRLSPRRGIQNGKSFILDPGELEEFATFTDVDDGDDDEEDEEEFEPDEIDPEGKGILEEGNPKAFVDGGDMGMAFACVGEAGEVHIYF